MDQYEFLVLFIILLLYYWAHFIIHWGITKSNKFKAINKFNNRHLESNAMSFHHILTIYH